MAIGLDISERAHALLVRFPQFSGRREPGLPRQVGIHPASKQWVVVRLRPAVARFPAVRLATALFRIAEVILETEPLEPVSALGADLGTDIGEDDTIGKCRGGTPVTA